MNRPTRSTSSRPVLVSSLSTLLLSILLFGSDFDLDAAEADGAEPISFSPIKVILVSDHLAFAPGKPFWLGIQQTIQPGFHTYWKNPGTVGLPTAVKWKLPTGFSAGPLLWPMPTHCQMVDYRVWGYKGEALLLTKITPPKDLALGQTFTFTGEASWMCCGKQCYPGFETLQITLPTATEPSIDPIQHQAFQKTLEQQPLPPEAWSLKAFDLGSAYELHISPTSPSDGLLPRSLQFFGYHRLVSSDKPQSTKLNRGAYIITLQPEEFSRETRGTLTGMLVSDLPWNPDRPSSPLEVHVPVQ